LKMSGFVDRENQIFEVLKSFKDHDLEFVVVGGYAVSAYHHRFSVDADLVIPEDELDEFTAVLEERGFEEIEDRDLAYSGRFIAYQKDQELPVTIDLLVDSLMCRQTDVSWSYQYFEQHSEPVEIQGSEQAVEVRVPERELLTAVKLHSGRLTDARDVVALAADLDLDKVREHIDRGDAEKLEQVLKQLEETISGEGFEDAFKGEFSRTELPEDNIQKVQEFIQNQVR